MFGSVTNLEIASYLTEKGLDVDRKKIVLGAAIKHTGEFTVPVKIHPEVTATLKVNVTAA